MLGEGGVPQLGRVVVMLELLVQRSGTFLPKHSHHLHQGAVAGRFGDAQMEQAIGIERLLAR